METVDYIIAMSNKIESALREGTTKSFNELVQDASAEIKAEEAK
jgi:hypothetical protein